MCFNFLCWSTFLSAPHISFVPQKSLYAMPTVAFYGGHFPIADVLLGVHCTQAEVPLIQLPPHVAQVIRRFNRGLEHPHPLPGTLTHPTSQCLIDNGTTEYDFFFSIFDVSQLIEKNGCRLNLVNHPWVFENELQKKFRPGLKMADLFDMGIFTYDGSLGTLTYLRDTLSPFHVLECYLTSPNSVHGTTPQICMPLQCLDQLRVSVHAQGVGMCCSPNNGRFMVQHSPDSPISFMWSVTMRKGIYISMYIYKYSIQMYLYMYVYVIIITIIIYIYIYINIL